MRPAPVTTPSPGIAWPSSIPKSRQRWVTSLSVSWKVPGSKRRSIRSRAVSLPASCCFFSRSSPPPSSARRSRSSSCLSCNALSLLPVLEELFQADVGQRMLEHRLDDRGGTGADVRPHARRLDHVNGMAHGRDQDLGRELIVLVDVDDVLNQ